MNAPAPSTPAPNDVQPPADWLLRTVEAVFEQHLQLEIEPPDAEDGEEAGSSWAAFVELTGGFAGRVELYADEQLVEATCGLLLERSPASLTEAERIDTWGEVANLVAGIILSDLPPDVRLSSPDVHHPAEPPLLTAVPLTAVPLASIELLVEGLPLAMRVHAHPRPPATSVETGSGGPR